MDTKFQCEQCDHKPFSTEQGLRMHQRWTHSPRGRKRMLAAARMNAARGRAANRAKSTTMMAKSNLDIEPGINRTPRRYKRKTYQRKPVRRQVLTPQQEGAVAIKYGEVVACPRCGCNMQAVKIAMNLTAEQLQG